LCPTFYVLGLTFGFGPALEIADESADQALVLGRLGIDAVELLLVDVVLIEDDVELGLEL
jgi:hypothetical protein